MKAFLSKLADKIFATAPLQVPLTFLEKVEKVMANKKTNKSNNMNNININGKNISVSGNNISIVNDKVIVDGVTVAEGLTGIVKIEFTGDLASLDCNTCVINGSVKGDVDANTVTCGDVGGDVDANTVKCLTIKGNVDANTVSGTY